MTRSTQCGSRTILLLCVSLLPTSVLAGEGENTECRGALEAAESIATMDAEERRRSWDLVFGACEGIDDPELLVRSAAFRILSMSSGEVRPFLEQTVASYEKQKPASPSLIPLIDALVGAALQDGCDVDAATRWVEKAVALRSLRSDGQGGEISDLASAGSHRYAIATCLMELGREEQGLAELRGAEATLRQALHAQARRDSFDSELRMYLIDGLRLTLDQLGATLDPDLEDEYDRLLHQSK